MRNYEAEELTEELQREIKDKKHLLEQWGQDVIRVNNLQNRVKALSEALEQAVHQLELDYEQTPLDGRAALIRKLRSAL